MPRPTFGYQCLTAQSGSDVFLEDNEVVIPFAVIEEIDNQKKRQDEIRFVCVKFCKFDQGM